MAAPAIAAAPQLMIAPPHSIKRAAATFSLPSWLCSHPTPVWTGQDFSACFEDMVFGCATNLVTVILITFYSINGPQNLRQEAKLPFRTFGFKRSLGVELLPAVATFITVLQIFQLFLFKAEKMGSSMHSWSYFGTQLIAWVASCRILYCRYEIAMTKYRILHLWWLLRTFFYIPILRTMINSSKVLSSPAIIEELLMFVFSLIFSILVFLNRREDTWSSNNSEYKELASVTEYLLQDGPGYGNVKEVSMGESIWEVLLFGWVTPLMDLGTTRQLTYGDLFKLPRELEPKICSKKLCQTWMEEQKLPMHRQSLFRAIYCTYGWRYLGIGFVKVLNDTLGFSGPLLLNAIVYNIEDGSQRSLHLGYWCALFMGVVSALRAFLGTQYTFLLSKLKLQLRASIITLIYRKALCVSLSERSFFSSGEIQTLMSVDSERTVNLCASFHEIWSLPLQMAAALSLLYMQVKFSFLAGLLVILLLIPVNKLIASKISTASQLMMEAKDERVRKIGEILTNIRTIKMCAWEDFFLKKVSESRQVEVKHLGVRKYLDAWCVYFWATTPILFSFFTFGLYSLLGHKLDAATVFTSLALFNMLISPLNSFPWVINGLIEASVSLNRLRKFLSCPEIDSSWIVEEDAGKRCKDFQVSPEDEVKSMSVVIEGADFAWAHFLQENPSPVLKNVSLSIPCGSVALVFGEVAAGKSSLLQAVLGEMRCLKGNFTCQGSLGYVSQNPWIQSGTIRENILFGKSYERERYISVLDACALDVDIERMAGKDLCVVGEHGFNLSGGQRARLALARALYQDSHILVLDDPLSSLDAHVSAWVLKYAIKSTLTSNKTIILATYNAQALTVADMVIFMEDGLVQWAGNASEFKYHFLSKDTQKFIRRKGVIDHYLHASKDDLSTKSNINSRKEDTESSFEKKEVSFRFQEGPSPLVEEETRVQGAVRAAVYWIYASFIGRGWLGAILLSTFFMQISRNGSDFWLSVWVDETSSDGNFHSAHFYLTVFLWIAIANSFFTAARAFSFAYGGLAAAFKVHETLLMRVITAPIYFFEHNPKGRLLNRFSSDQYAVDDSLPFISNIFLANFFSLLGIFCILCMVQWTFVILLVPLSFFYLSLQKYYRSTSRELRRLDSTSRSPVYSSFTEALDGSPTIRAFKVQSMFSATNEGLIAVNQQTSYSEIAASLWLSVRLQLLAAFIIFFISIMAFLGRDKRSPVNSVTAGLVGLGLSYASPIISLLSDLLSTFTETEKEMVSVERIQEYMDIQREESEVAPEPKMDWPKQGSIYFDQVTLLYGPLLPPALKEISFNIEGGSQVGIAGRTGSGKSSILNALFRLTKPISGCIFIDGVNTANVPLLQLRSNLAIVPQSPFLFEGTLRDNMDPHGKVTDFNIWDALNKCHLKEIVTLGGGLDMHVMESGEGFSVGQRQLLCLARCLLHHTKVLCLDECTANVDPQTANLVQQTIASECKGITVITIAHRMSSILNLDHVLILDHGELVEEGNPRHLLQDSSSKFSSFVNAIHIQQ